MNIHRTETFRTESRFPQGFGKVERGGGGGVVLPRHYEGLSRSTLFGRTGHESTSKLKRFYTEVKTINVYTKVTFKVYTQTRGVGKTLSVFVRCYMGHTRAILS